MRRVWVIAVGLVLVGIGGAAGALATTPAYRVATVEGLCKLGLPNLSRPPEIDAEALGCVVVSPLRSEVGLLESGFEHSNLVIGDRYRVDEAGGYANETGWFQSAPGVELVGVERRPPPPEECLLMIVGVSVEGWMTLSGGGFGHLNGADRAFYARRIHGFSPVRPEQVAELDARVRAHACGWTGEGWAPLAG